MKTSLISLALVIPAIAALAQGKVSFGNNSDRYFVLGDPGHLLPADGAIGGGVGSTAQNTVSGAPGAIPVSPLPSGVTLVAALYAGTTDYNMTLQKSVVLDATGWLQAGRMANQNVILTGVPGGAPAVFEIWVYDNLYATPQAAAAAHAYHGTSGYFTATPGNSITYPNLFAGGPANSTWGVGNLVIVNFIPEPSTLALLALASAVAIVRRKVNILN